MSSLLNDLRGVQSPRLEHYPAFASSAGSEAVECAALAGLHLDPWQKHVLDRACGETAEGKWAAFEMAVCVPRQNGKGAIIEALELAGLFVWGERLIIHSAHEFSTARAAFRRLEELIAGTPEFSKRVKRISRTNGDEGIEFKSGQKVQYRTRTKSGGRGLTGDRVILDEAMILPAASISSLIYTMSARSINGNPQMCYFGSAVDQMTHSEGIVFSKIRARGLQGEDPSLAYFEWSVDCESPDDLLDSDAGDEDSWALANPGIGIRISAEHVAKEYRSVDRRSFSVERLGVGDWPAVDDVESAFDMQKWRDIADPDSTVVDPVVFAFDSSPARSKSSIGVSGRREDDLWHSEIVDSRHGTQWLIPRLVELKEKNPTAVFVCDGKGPAASLIPALEQEGLSVQTLTSSELAQGCGFLFDMVDQEGLRVIPTSELNAAVYGAAKRPLGDSWVWSRKNSGVDITPLMVVTASLWVASTRQNTGPEVAAIWA